jgi:hypothetical protein
VDGRQYSSINSNLKQSGRPNWTILVLKLHEKYLAYCGCFWRINSGSISEHHKMTRRSEVL